MKAQVKYQEQPLQNLTLEGLHLIEASAGTGKTWTLSSLMVRILTEKYMPRQVIATTFTRAAAAELKSRIRKRLQEIYHVAILWQALNPTQYPKTLEDLKDPLQQILFKKFQYNEQQDFQYLVNRLKLVIDSLDELFVGTIDSFTQKLLREFSFDSGEILPRQISEDEKQYPYQIVHDELRAWINTQPQEIIDIFLLSKKLKSVEDYIDVVQKTLNFSQAKFQEVTQPKLDISGFKTICQDLVNLVDQGALVTLEPYCSKDGKYYQYVNKNAFRKDKLVYIFSEYLPKFIHYLKTKNEIFYFHESLKNLGSQLDTVFLDSKNKIRESIFNKCTDDIVQGFYHHPIIVQLQKLFEIKTILKQQFIELDDYLSYYLSVQVKKKLPNTLLQAGETTFNQQIRTLSEALNHTQQQVLAQAIQQRYPIILVDEFQDTNQEQDNMLQAIWRHPNRLTQGCFIAVGDPKQAIYGFRGGDVLTYINAFNDIAKKQGYFYRLSHNFRSIPYLVQAVDALFRQQIQFGEDIEYYLAQYGLGDDLSLVENGQIDQTPLRFIQLEDGANEAFLIARKIQYILWQSQQGQLYFQQGHHKIEVLPEDIAVLASSHWELNQVQKQLERLNILVNRKALNSVFESPVAQDMGALLQAIIYPENENILKRALLSPVIGLTLADFCQFEMNAELMSQHIQHFRQARQIWLQRGFLIAWQCLAETYQIWQNLAKHSGEQAERQIVNLRHLVELLSQHSQHYQGIQHLIQWYLLQLGSPAQREWELERTLSSESGVQLMTIHKSKGLEFKIVFLMHANKEIKIKDNGLAFYQETQPQQQPVRVIAISPQLIQENQAAQQAHQEKITGENHRLWYVALTRASYRIYAVFHHQEKPPKIQGGVAFWCDANADRFRHAACCDEVAASPQISYQAKAKQVQKLYAVPYPKQQFYPKTRTSFSGLAAHLQHQQAVDVLAAVNAQLQGAEDEASFVMTTELSPTPIQPLLWIRKYFPRGRLAGNCLHEIFEIIDFQHPELWEQDVMRKLKYHGLWQELWTQFQQDFPQQHEQDLKQQIYHWIEEILLTPIQQNQSYCLKQITSEYRLAEFEFFLALKDQRFDTQKIYQIFLDYGIAMPEFERANTARYLNGAIDLIYFDGQRYHIADYKSNYLGDDLACYQTAQLEYNMSASSYWLQASIYLVALHRYLSHHLADYSPEQYLGGASYLYLRGMCGQAGYGVKHWQPDLQLILDLDQYLGQCQNIPQFDFM